MSIKNRKRILSSAKTSVVRRPLSLEDRILEDELVVRTVKKLDNLLKHFDVEALANEAVNKHATKRIRTLSVQEVLSNQQTQVIEATLQNQAYRSRVLEIKLTTVRIHYTITDGIDIIRKYVNSTYSSSLKNEGYTTINDRTNYVDAIFRKYLTFSNEMYMLSDLCDQIIKDFDEAGWAIQRIIKALELTSRER